MVHFAKEQYIQIITKIISGILSLMSFDSIIQEIFTLLRESSTTLPTSFFVCFDYIQALPCQLVCSWGNRNIFSCDQAALWMVQSVCTSVFHTFLTMFRSSYPHEIINDRSDVLTKGQDQRSKVKVAEITTPLNRFRTETPITYDDEMMHRDWCCVGEVLYCFSMSSVKVTRLKKSI